VDGRACQRLIESLQFSLQLGILPWRSSATVFRVIGALGLRHLQAGGLERLPQLAHLVDRALLSFPVSRRAFACSRASASSARSAASRRALAFVLFLGEGGLLNLQPEDATRQLVELLRHRVHLRPDHRTGLVHEVDGLVGQKAVGDVPVGKRDGADERGVLDATPWCSSKRSLMRAGSRARPRAGRFDEHGLEATLKRGVLSMCLRYSSSVVAPRQCNSPRASIGLREVARVHRAFGLAGAHDEVELVDEQQDAGRRSV